VPWEVLQQPGKVEVSAFCGDLHTANIAVVSVEKTGYKSGDTPKDPTPDVYQQLAKMVQEAVDTANSVREDADAGDFDGEKYIDRKISEAIASAAETKLASYDTLSGAIHEGVNEA